MVGCGIDPEKWERPGWGSGSLNLETSTVGGTDFGYFNEWNIGGCSHVEFAMTKYAHTAIDLPRR
jgi:hypothetical protein